MTELVPVESLKPHPRNYRQHPEDQLEHIMESIRRNGIYRNIVVARGNVILAGHGVVMAAKKLEMREVPIHRLDIDHDSPAALKVLAGDNEISLLGFVDQRQLTEILKDIKVQDVDLGLLGTGFNEATLANLLFISRPASEIGNKDEAAHWAGMPDYENDAIPKIIFNFETKEARAEFCKMLALKVSTPDKTCLSYRWPIAARDDLASVRLEPDLNPDTDPVSV